MHADSWEFSAADFTEDRYSSLRLIPWWEQHRLSAAAVIVIGAGAIGNELIKDLALLGVGKILIVDMDRIESANLARSVLYRAKDIGRLKAEVAAERAMEINPDIKARAFPLNIMDGIGLGVFRRVDAALGGLDNREARLAVNQFCFKVNKPFIDGAIEALNGVARVFLPPDGPCYECTMSETDWQLLNKRKSCALLSAEEIGGGKIPTTPTSSAIIAAIQTQEFLKLLHRERNLPLLAGKGYVFDGLYHDSFIVEYPRNPDCLNHSGYGPIIEKPWSARLITLREMLAAISAEMGANTVIDLDRDIATSASCACGAKKELYFSVRRLNKSLLTCEKCGAIMNFKRSHTISGKEDFLDKTLFEIGIPLLHVIDGRRGTEIRHYELSGDAEEIFAGF
jgi:adenylyltransferase/sulfurtransferase